MSPESWIGSALLWADMELFRSLGSGFRGKRAHFSSDDLYAFVGIVVGCVIAAVVLSKLLARQERQRSFHSPWALFRQLCKAHALDWRTCWLLWKIARAHQLAHPARLFLEPERFDLVGLGPDFASQADQIEELREQLFAGWNEAEELPPQVVFPRL